MQGVFIPVSAQETDAVQKIELSEEEFYALNKPQLSVEDDFADNRVIVVLKNEDSLKFNEYKTTDFLGLGCKKVNDLSSHTGEIMKKKIESKNVDVAAVGLLNTDMFIENKISDVNVNKYNQILCLELDEYGKQNVLDIIDELNKRDDVLYAMPDMAVYADGELYENVSNNQEVLTTQEDLMSICDAWEINTGSSSVKVGVVDSGINGDHPDLISNLDTTGLHRDFSWSLGALEDPAKHGTRVASVIGAQGDNGIGMYGVCWDVTLVSLRVLDDTGKGYSSYVCEAIDYANDNKIPILNLSLGWGSHNESYYEDPFDDVIGNYYGLAVCSAGNKMKDNDSNWHYPSSYDEMNIIAVGASTQSDQIWELSNYGQTSVDLFATGEDIYTCYGITYGTTSGTSFAAPHVTGVAVLLLSEYPDMHACELKTSIMENVDTSPIFHFKCVSGGRLNAYEALSNPADHNITYIIRGAAMHTAICTTPGCGDVYTELHCFLYISNYYECSDCGYITQQLPSIMQAIIPDNEYDDH